MEALGFEHVATFTTDYYTVGERVFVHGRRDGAIATAITGIDLDEIGRAYLMVQWLPMNGQDWGPSLLYPMGGGWKDAEDERSVWKGYFLFDQDENSSSINSLSFTMIELLEHGALTPQNLKNWDFMHCLTSSSDYGGITYQGHLHDEDEVRQVAQELGISRAQEIAVTHPWFLELAGIKLAPSSLGQTYPAKPIITRVTNQFIP